MFSIDIKLCAKNSARVIKKARHRVISNIKNSKSYSKVDEKYVSRLINMAKQKSANRGNSNMSAYLEKDIQTDINCFVNTSRFCPKTVNTVQDKALHTYANGTGIEESVWLVNVIISPDGTYKIPDFDNKSGALNEGSKESEEGDDEMWHRVSQELLKQYPAKSDYLNPEPERCNYNSLDEMPPISNIPPSTINQTCPRARDWVDKLVEGKIKKFSSFDIENHYFNPVATDTPHKIELKEGATVPIPHRYRTPEHLVSELKKFIEEMLSKGWIETGETEFNAPVLILKKPGTYEDGSSKGYRMCSDFRALNAVVETTSHYLPTCDEMWEKLRHANYISVLDMKFGYWSCPVTEDSRKYLGIVTPWAVYRYKVLPMGYVNASYVFQRYLERKLRKHGLLYEQVLVTDDSTNLNSKTKNDLHGVNFDKKTHKKLPKTLNKRSGKFRSKRHKRSTSFDCNLVNTNKSNLERGEASVQLKNPKMYGFAACYQDDIVCHSDTLEQHKAHIIRLLDVLSEEKIPLNAKKCQFACKYVRYLGCVVGSQKLMMDPQKLSSMKDMTVEKNITSIKSFLGCTGYYRRWISDYAGLTRPLTQLTKKDINIKEAWNENHDKAIEKLKNT